MGHRARRSLGAAAVAPGDDRGPRRSRRADLRPRAGRRDVPRAAHRAGARPLGPAAARRRGRSGGDRGRGRRERRSLASEVVVNVAGRVAIDLRLAGVLRTKPTLLQRLNPVPATSPSRCRVAGRAPARRAPGARRAPARPRRRRSRRGAVTRRALQPPTAGALPSRPCGAALAARARDPDGHPHRRRRQPDDRRVDRAARAGRGAAAKACPTRTSSSAARWCSRSPRHGSHPEPSSRPTRSR